MAVTVRIHAHAHAALAGIARAKRLTLTEALSRAIEAYRIETFLEGVASDFAVLRHDPAAWSEEVSERAPWEMAAADGLEQEPPHVDARDGAKPG